MLCWSRVLKIKRAVVGQGAGIKALDLVLNPTWKQRVLISAKTAESLVSGQQAVNCQLTKPLLFPFMVSLRGGARVETGSESVSWREHEIGTCFVFFLSLSLFWNLLAHSPVGHHVRHGWWNAINCLDVQNRECVSCLQNARWGWMCCFQRPALNLINNYPVLSLSICLEVSHWMSDTFFFIICR